MSSATHKFLLIGSQISHSLSPFIHNCWLKHNNIANTYGLLETTTDNLAENLEFIKKNTIGFNVTAPLKEVIIPHLSYLSDEAKELGAVNTVKVVDGQLHGYNTDIDGLKASIPSTSFFDKRATALVLGSGGAARAVIYTLNKLGYSILVSARNIKTLALLKKDFTYISILPWGNYLKTNLIINATSSLLKKDEYPFEIISDFVIDLHYNSKDDSSLLGRAITKTKLDGLTMLVYQAAKAFTIWHDIEPDIGLVKIKLIRGFKK